MWAARFHTCQGKANQKQANKTFVGAFAYLTEKVCKAVNAVPLGSDNGGRGTEEGR